MNIHGNENMQVINPQPLFIEDKIKEQSQWLLTMFTDVVDIP